MLFQHTKSAETIKEPAAADLAQLRASRQEAASINHAQRLRILGLVASESGVVSTEQAHVVSDQAHENTGEMLKSAIAAEVPSKPTDVGEPTPPSELPPVQPTV